MVLTPEVEQVLTGRWAVHPGNLNFFAEQRFARWPTQHIDFDGPAWRRYETGRRWRLKRAGVSAGFWRSFDVGGRALLVLTVRSYQRSRVAEAMIGAGPAGSATLAQAAHDVEAEKMRDGEARMYFLPVQVEPDRITVTLPSNGIHAPRQRWVRVGEE